MAYTCPTLSTMKKKHAFDVFGGPVELARMLGLRRQSVYAWPEDLPQKTEDRLIGLALRKGLLRELLSPPDAPQS